MTLAKPHIAIIAWLLVVHAFATDRGHTVALGSYVFRLPEDVYATERECEAAGERRLKTFHAPVQANGTRLIPGYTCELQP